MKMLNGAKILFFCENKTLLFRRDDKPTIPYPDCWQLVGGGIEEGETPEEALIREVKEEVNYDLANYEFLAKVDGYLGEEVWVYAAFVDQDEVNKFKLGPDEGQEIGWFTIEEALKLKLTDGTKINFIKRRGLIEKMMREKKAFKEEWLAEG